MQQGDEIRQLVVAVGTFNLSLPLTTRIQLNEINMGLEMMEHLSPLDEVIIN